jgi:hypothetical protein
MKPKGDSFVGTGQRISQSDTILRGNEGVKHRLKRVEQIIYQFLSRQGSDLAALLSFESSLDHIAAIRYIALVALVRYIGISFV